MQQHILAKARQYQSKRLQQAYLFLSSIQLDGTVTYTGDEALRLVEEPCPSPALREPLEQSLCRQDSDLSQISSSSTVIAGIVPRPLSVHHSVSVSTTANVEDEVKYTPGGRRCIADTPVTDRGVKGASTLYGSKSVDEAKVGVESRIIYLDSSNGFPLPWVPIADSRIVLISHHHVPVKAFSVIPYRRNVASASDTQGVALTLSHMQGCFIDGLEVGDSRDEVSYSHLLEPSLCRKSRPYASVSFTPEDHEQITDNGESQGDCPPTVDDPELTSGKHRTVLNLPSYMVSVIQYAKPSALKKDINERFKARFPMITITLTKLRSIKKEMTEIALKMCLDPVVLSCAIVYFEKLVLKMRITKYNRKYIAGACMLLSLKFYDDFQSKAVKRITEAIVDQFRLNVKELVMCELQVLIALEFALLLSINEVLPVYKRLETSL